MRLQGQEDLYEEATKAMRRFPSFGVVMGRPPLLGKLSTKEEAAGKIRVFAIVDYWTQRVSEPWHNVLFQVLKELDYADGTFDQNGLVTRMAERGYTHAYSFDLKAATDIIPMELYKVLLSSRFGILAAQWLSFIVDRDYRIPLNKATKDD
jgi:hypothetical protein